MVAVSVETQVVDSRSLLPRLEQHRAKHDQGNDQDDDEFANAKHDLADLDPVRYGVGPRRDRGDDGAVQPGVPRFVDLTHAARAEGGVDLVGAERGAR